FYNPAAHPRTAVAHAAGNKRGCLKRLRMQSVPWGVLVRSVRSRDFSSGRCFGAVGGVRGVGVVVCVMRGPLGKTNPVSRFRTSELETLVGTWNYGEDESMECFYVT
ncbi:unnamed protein product, partial [Ectocarpus sp. 13 AM-2016]